MKFDLVVIGSGPAGQKAALQAAKAGKSVVIVEEFEGVGGGCLHLGTVPSKALRESIYRYSLGSRGTMGQEAEHHVKKSKSAGDLPDLRRLWRRRNRVVSGEAQVIFDQLKRNGVQIVHGHARFVSTREIEVQSQKAKRKITGDIFLVAVGARPVSPPHIAIDGKVVHDSNTILALKEMPRSMVVLGAGIIGCEYASMFSMAGVQVTLVDKRNEMLASVDREIVKNLTDLFIQYGMDIILGTEATEVERANGKDKTHTYVHLKNGQKVRTDAVLVAQGRAGNTEDMGLKEVGVEVDERGLIKVDSRFRTKVKHIYAAGDVIGAPALASTAMEQGRLVSVHGFGLKGWGDGEAEGLPKLFPYGVYTIPEISMVGPTEEDLKKSGADYVVGRARYHELARGQIVGDRYGILKLVVDRKTLKLLSVHIMGDNAADLIHIGQAVMDFEGDVTYFVRTVFNYPTLAEAYKTAAFHAINQIRGVTKSR